MLRKLMIAVAAVGLIGAASIETSAVAVARGGGGHGGGGRTGFGGGGHIGRVGGGGFAREFAGRGYGSSGSAHEFAGRGFAGSFRHGSGVRTYSGWGGYGLRSHGHYGDLCYVGTPYAYTSMCGYGY